MLCVTAWHENPWKDRNYKTTKLFIISSQTALPSHPKGEENRRGTREGRGVCGCGCEGKQEELGGDEWEGGDSAGVLKRKLWVG